MSDNVIMTNWREPFHRAHRPEAEFHGRAVSTACGDEIDLYLDTEDGVVTDAFFEGDGCIVCLGMASLLVRYLEGRSVEEVREMTAPDALKLATDVAIESRRQGCALVAFKALGEALRSAS